MMRTDEGPWCCVPGDGGISSGGAGELGEAETRSAVGSKGGMAAGVAVYFKVWADA